MIVIFLQVFSMHTIIFLLIGSQTLPKNNKVKGYIKNIAHPCYHYKVNKSENPSIKLVVFSPFIVGAS